ncbi:hypothetical protein [Paenibacillus mendelii]|uniref:Uncharacterized protein n=1 Tax=Paenibacillus mendelii TaxID=206163 RepID=A0ABV6JDB9_9BACL|nr:hypothetical protein [Paenibacillus mendelii]MCQ6562509.1 hypothetical protein [Paenibacillus mendelii]
MFPEVLYETSTRKENTAAIAVSFILAVMIAPVRVRGLTKLSTVGDTMVRVTSFITVSGIGVGVEKSMKSAMRTVEIKRMDE